MEVDYRKVALNKIKIHKKYLAIGKNRKMYNIIGDPTKVDYILNFGIPIEFDIYYFLKKIRQLALIGVFNFTAYYKRLSIKNLGLTNTEHMHYLVPFQLKLYLNYKKIMDLQNYRWMNIKNIFVEEINFVNEEKEREFNELFKNHCYFCRILFCYLFKKIENNLKKLTNEDFIKMICFFNEKKRDFEEYLIIYSLIKSENPKAKKFLFENNF